MNKGNSVRVYQMNVRPSPSYIVACLMINDLVTASLVGGGNCNCDRRTNVFNQKSTTRRTDQRHKSTRHSPHVWILCVQLFFHGEALKSDLRKERRAGHKNGGKGFKLLIIYDCRPSSEGIGRLV